MRQKLIKIKNEDGSVSYQKTRCLTYVNIKQNEFDFKDLKGNLVEPTELELELRHEGQFGGTHILNGWLTFIGVMTLINLFIQFLLVAKS